MRKDMHRACITKVRRGDKEIVVRVSVAASSEDEAKRVAREFARVVNTEHSDDFDREPE